MAVINGKTDHVQHGVLQTTWAGLATGDTGTTQQLSRYPVHSVQFLGTFGGSTVTLEGSDDNVTFFTLTGESAAGGADSIVSTAAATRFDIKNIVPLHIRPKVTGGAGVSVTVILTSRSFGH